MLSLIIVCVVLCYIGYVLNEEITIEEFFLNCVISILVSLFFFGVCLIPFNNDIYYQSGRLNRVEYHPYFVEEYEQRHEEQYACGKDDEGNTEYCTRVYYTTEHAKHYPYWLAKDTLGQEKEITQKFYLIIGHDFGFEKSYNSGRTCRCTHGGHRISGDNTLYYFTNDRNTYNYPTTAWGSWYNPLKRSQSIFNTEKNLNYPSRYDWLANNRSPIKRKDWDILNTKLYEKMGLNVILTTSREDLKHDWMRGKKNDIVIQVNNVKNPTTVKVFGWFKNEILASKLETYILDNGINLDGIKHVILSYYEPFDFHEFDYLKYHLADRQLILISIITIITMIISYVIFSTNEFRR